MNIIIFGPPCSGKGTYSNIISNRYNLLHISIGEMLRKKNDNYINQIINNGELLDDQIIFDLLKNYINKNNNFFLKNRILLDGFPRNVNQAINLNNIIKIDIILKLNVNDNIILKRFIGRKIHRSSGRIYHDLYNPPKIPNIDDITGEPLEIRSDDDLNIIKKRILDYNLSINNIINIYNQDIKYNNIKYININSNKSIELVTKDIISELDRYNCESSSIR